MTDPFEGLPELPSPGKGDPFDALPELPEPKGGGPTLTERIAGSKQFAAEALGGEKQGVYIGGRNFLPGVRARDLGIPFVGGLMNNQIAEDYRTAKKALDETPDKVTDKQLGTVAVYEANEAYKNRPKDIPEHVADIAAQTPAFLIENLTGMGVAKKAAQGLGWLGRATGLMKAAPVAEAAAQAVAPTVARGLIPRAAMAAKEGLKGAAVQAAITPITPTSWVELAQQRAMQGGGDASDFKNWGPALAKGAIQNFMVGHSMGATKGMGVVPRAVIGGVTFEGEMIASDAAVSALENELVRRGMDKAWSTETKYGSVGKIMRGESGEGLKEIAAQMIFGGAMSALTGGKAKVKPAEQVAKVFDHLAEKGATQDQAAEVLQKALVTPPEQIKDPVVREFVEAQKAPDEAKSHSENRAKPPETPTEQGVPEGVKNERAPVSPPAKPSLGDPFSEYVPKQPPRPLELTPASERRVDDLIPEPPPPPKKATLGGKKKPVPPTEPVAEPKRVSDDASRPNVDLEDFFAAPADKPKPVEAKGLRDNPLLEDIFGAPVDERLAPKKFDPEQYRAQQGATNAAAAAKPVDRRQDSARRKRVAEMDPDERMKELLTSQVVDLPNRRAFEEAGPAKVVAMSDADALKAFNDTYGYAAGDQLLKAKAEALKMAGLDAYHEKGDEFLYRSDDPADLKAKMDKAREILRASDIVVTMKDGTTRTFRGADFSYGVGNDLQIAEAGLKGHKAEREARGERARGELRGIAEVGQEPGGGRQSPPAQPQEAVPGPPAAGPEVPARPEEQAKGPQVPRGQTGRLAGRDTEVLVQGTKPVPARYEVRELRSVTASDTPGESGGFMRREEYPEGLQPRSYTGNQAEMEKVRRFAQEMQTAQYLTDDPNATGGPPTITEDGAFVINGNGRQMSLEEAARTGTYAKYKADLIAKAAQFGIDPKAVEGMKEPVLYRVVDMDPSGDVAKEFARRGNETTTQKQTPERRAASLGATIDDAVLDSLKLTGDETFAQAVNSPKGDSFRRKLREKLPPSVVTEFFNPDDTLNDAGKVFVGDMLITKIVPVEVLESLKGMDKRLANSVEAASPQLVALNRNKEVNPVPALNEALKFLADNPGITDMSGVANALDQQDIFGKRASISPGGRMLLDFIMKTAAEGRTKVFREKLVEMTGDLSKVGKSNLFGDVGPKLNEVEKIAEVLGVKPRTGAKFKPAGPDPAKATLGATGKALDAAIADIRDRVSRNVSMTRAELTAELAGLKGVPRKAFDDAVAALGYKSKPKTVEEAIKLITNRLLGPTITNARVESDSDPADFGRPLTPEESRMGTVGGGSPEGGPGGDIGRGLRETALANAQVDQERVKNGLPPLMAAARRENQAVWDSAMSRLAQDRDVSARLVDELTAKTRATTVDENALLLHRKIALANEHERTVRQALVASRKRDMVEFDRLVIREEELLAQIDKLDKVTRSTGTEWGRAGQFRKQLAEEDYSLSRMIGKATIAKKAPLDAKETAKVVELSDRIKELEARLKELEAPKEPAKPTEPARPAETPDAVPEAQRGVLARIGEWLGGIFQVKPKPTLGKAPEKKSAAWDFADRMERDAAKELMAKFGPDKLFSGFDPTAIVPLAKYTAAKIIKTGLTFADFSKQIIAKFGDDIKPHLDDIWKKAQTHVEDSKRDKTGTQVEINRAKTEAQSMLSAFKRKNMSLGQKAFGAAKETNNAIRAFITAYDLSAVFRQGAMLTLGNPVKATKAAGEMMKSALSPDYYDRAQEKIKERPNAKNGLYDASGLYLADQYGPPTAQEEAFIGRWVQKLPGVAASERAYTAYLNRMRADVFDGMVDKLVRDGTPNMGEAKAIANYVNKATGRGTLPGRLEGAAAELAHVFFSPRYLASRFQILAGQPFFGGSARTRGMIAKEYGKALAGLGLFYAAAKALAGDEAEITFDPRSADFGKVKLGNARIDPLAGLSQITVLGGRLASGQTKSTQNGVTRDIRGPKLGYGKEDSGDVLLRFTRNKMSPVAGAASDVLLPKYAPQGNKLPEDILGKGIAVKVGGAVIPISANELYATMKDQGLPRGTILSLLAILGMGTQVYDRK
jgi:GGDEF domain-containing protein